MAQIIHQAHSNCSNCSLTEWLKSQPFDSLGAQEHSLLENTAKICQFSRKDTIYQEGDRRDFVYSIVSGIAIQKRRTSENGTIALDIVRPGQLLGLLSFETNRPYLLTTNALTNLSAVQIPIETMRTIWKSSPDLMKMVSRMLMQHLAEAYESISHSGFSRADQRILATLINISEPLGACLNSRYISFPVTRREIAELSHTTVETTIRVLKKWEKNGWLITRKKKITLVSMNSLQTYVENIKKDKLNEQK